jgi:hypothetical protein
MFASQLSRAFTSDPYASDCFEGVFPCDRLPVRVKYPSILVANTDPEAEKGEHWVAFCFDPQGNAEYFDSFGLPPSNCDLHDFYDRNGVTHNYNKTQLQGIESDACGHYCIAFLTNRVRGEPMQEIVDRYKGSKPGVNDQAIKVAVNNEYNIKNNDNNQQGSGYYFFNNQCCCCKKSWRCYSC